MRYIFPLLLVSATATSCMNMPTPTSQITGSPTTGIEYKSLSCSKLSREMDALIRRENQLVIAQEQRIKTSQMQAIWHGFGQGDGVEASQLAEVRGSKESLMSVMADKNCS